MTAPTGQGAIDVHAHVVLEGSLGAAGEFGPFLQEDPPRFTVGDWHLDGVRYRGTPFMDVDVRVARMDEAGIDIQALSPNPLTWFHHIDAAAAVDFCRAHNDSLSEIVGSAPDRLVGWAQLPAQDPVASADEIERAATLPGIAGVAMSTDVGRPLSDPVLDPIWSAAERLDLPIYLHPAPPAIAGTADPRTMVHDFELYGGFANEEPLAVVSLVFGGVLDRFPALDVCISHGGGAMPMLVGRMRHAMATRPSGSGDPDDVDRGLARLWFDNHVGGEVAAAALIGTVGSDRVVVGTNFAGWDDTGVHHHGVAPETLRSNAVRLLRLDFPIAESD